MKKSLLALAVLGAYAGVASAQSSVTLYGATENLTAKKLTPELAGAVAGCDVAARPQIGPAVRGEAQCAFR